MGTMLNQLILKNKNLKNLLLHKKMLKISTVLLLLFISNILSSMISLPPF